MTAFAQAERSPRVAEGSVTPQQVSTFRPDIQGLRAVAVLAVAFDHAHLHGFSGGFVGVDVFFVISGFLITQLLLREAQRTGSISLTQFYGRRARRILPAATLVLVTTVIASVVLLGYVRATSVIIDSIWATFFAANVKFGRDGTDYFSNDSPPSPLQHYWSLSIEEQFYFVWPVLLLLLLAVALLWRRRRRAGRPAAPGDAGDGTPAPDGGHPGRAAAARWRLSRLRHQPDRPEPDRRLLLDAGPRVGARHRRAMRGSHRPDRPAARLAARH